jgi:hypothetical protein
MSFMWGETDVHVTVHCDKFHIRKPTRGTDFSILFWNKTLCVLDSSSLHHQEYFTVHTAMPVFRQLASRIILMLLASCLKTGIMYTVAVCTVKYS